MAQGHVTRISTAPPGGAVLLRAANDNRPRADENGAGMALYLAGVTSWMVLAWNAGVL